MTREVGQAVAMRHRSHRVPSRRSGFAGFRFRRQYEDPGEVHPRGSIDHLLMREREEVVQWLGVRRDAVLRTGLDATTTH